MHTEWTRYGGEYSGYMARPERAPAPLPGLVVIQEVWGVDSHIQDVTRRFAAAGYVAFAPDLFARVGERPPELSEERLRGVQGFMDSWPPTAFGDQAAREAALQGRADADAIRSSYTTMLATAGQTERHLAHLLETTRYLREECGATKGGRVGVLGFCVGGMLSALLACHDPALNLAIVFYGSAPKPELIPGIQCPVLGFYGATDSRITDAVPAFAEAMRSAGKQWLRGYKLGR